MATSRRDFLRTATGLVAATAVGGALFQMSGDSAHAAQQQGAAIMNLSILARIDGLSGEFAAHSLSMGLEGSAASARGGGGGAGKVSFHDLSINKMMDGFSPLLYMLAASGQSIKEVSLRLFDQAGAEVGAVKLNDAMIVRVQSSVPSGDEQPVELVSFYYNRISFNYQGSSFGWDVKSNKKA